MTIPNMAFNPTDGLRNVTVYETVPASEADLRNQVQTGMDQLRDYINGTLIPGLPVPADKLTFADLFTDFAASGFIPSTSATLTTTTPAGVAYVQGTRVTTTNDSHTYVGSTDTYIDVSNIGTLTYVQVANGAAAPAITANSIRVAKVVTSTSAVTTVTDLRTLTQLTKILKQEAWITPTLQNAWVNYGGTDSVAAYYKDSNGNVHIKGVIKNGSVNSGFVIFNLPAGYRPIEDLRFSVSNYNGTSYTTAVLILKANGDLIIASVPSAAMLILNDIPPFRAEQ